MMVVMDLPTHQPGCLDHTIQTPMSISAKWPWNWYPPAPKSPATAQQTTAQRSPM